MNKINKKLVVTGSSGFIGRPLVEALEADGYSLIKIDYADNCDITSIMDLAACFEGEQKGDIDAIFHLGLCQDVRTRFME